MSALRSPTAVLLFLLTTAVGLSLDQWTKVLAFNRLTDGVKWNVERTEVYPVPKPDLPKGYEFIPGYLHFEFIPNRGAVFGIGQGYRLAFIAVSVLAIGFIFYLFAVSGKQHFYQLILGMLLAGVLGNLYDRYQFQYVRDMIHALPSVKVFNREVFPYIFNVADSFLCVGVFLMIVHSLFHAPKESRK